MRGSAKTGPGRRDATRARAYHGEWFPVLGGRLRASHGEERVEVNLAETLEARAHHEQLPGPRRHCRRTARHHLLVLDTLVEVLDTLAQVSDTLTNGQV